MQKIHNSILHVVIASRHCAVYIIFKGMLCKGMDLFPISIQASVKHMVHKLKLISFIISTLYAVGINLYIFFCIVLDIQLSPSGWMMLIAIALTTIA